MATFHSGPNGSGPCGAQKGRCPFGGESGQENHFDTAEEAQSHFEKTNSNQTLNAVSKVSPEDKVKESSEISKMKFTNAEINKTLAKYPDSEVLEKGSYSISPIGDSGAASAVLDPYSYPDYNSAFGEDKLDNESTDEEIESYAKARGLESDQLKFMREMDEYDKSGGQEKPDYLTSVNGDYNNGFNESILAINTDKLAKQYPGAVNKDGSLKFAGPNSSSIKLNSSAPIVHATSSANGDRTFKDYEKADGGTGELAGYAIGNPQAKNSAYPKLDSPKPSADNRFYSDKEISDITKKYPNSKVLEPGSYVVTPNNEGVHYALPGGVEFEKSGLKTDASDSEVKEYAKTSGMNEDVLRLARDTRKAVDNNSELPGAHSKVEGAMNHGYDESLTVLDAKKLQKEYPKAFDAKGNLVNNENGATIELKHKAPLVNILGPDNGEDLYNETEKKRFTTASFVTGDPAGNSSKGKFYKLGE